MEEWRPSGDPAPQAALPVNGPGAEAPPVQIVDNRTPGQVVVDILQQNGYSCAAEDTRWVCTLPTEPGWPFTVSYVPEETKTTIWIDSYIFRAFGKRCAQYTNHMADLAVPDNAFAVTCDDTTQQFRMNQSLLDDRAERAVRVENRRPSAQRANTKHALTHVNQPSVVHGSRMHLVVPAGARGYRT